jgi:hypothetical protein
MEITVLSGENDFVRRLGERPPPDSGNLLAIDAPTRVPGHVDTVAMITAQLQSIPANIAGSLIAAWLWGAFRGSVKNAKAHLTLRSGEREAEIEIEGADEAKLIQVVTEAVRGVYSDG